MVRSKGSKCERCIIYCQTVNQCSTIFSLFTALVGTKLYLHQDRPKPKERLVEMMHSKTPESVKETILKSMADYDGHVRVLICTIAFGMGVDAKGVRNIINFGPSRNLESYVQESGRCSRDGKPGKCVILYFGRMMSTCAKDMKDYVSSQSCRRQQINSYFDQPAITTNSNTLKPSGHNCCDNCATSCHCSEGGCNVKTICSVEHSPQAHVCREPLREVSASQNADLKRGLLTYKKKWVSYCMHRNLQSQTQVSAISCPTFLMEFGDFHIEQVLENAPYIGSMKDILNYVEIWRMNHAVEVCKLLRGVFPDMEDEALPDVSNQETDSLEEEDDDDDDDDDWMRILDESFDVDSTPVLFGDESMDVEEDAATPAHPHIVDNVLSFV